MRTKKKAIMLAALTFALLVGIGLVVYPLIGNYYSQRYQTYAEAVYRDEIEHTPDTTLQDTLEAARLYNFQLFQGAAAGEIVSYEDQLNLAGNGVMGYLSIPCIDVTLPIYHGVASDTMTQGAGHMPATSLPVGGESSHCVLSAHTGVANKKLFTDLEKMVEGDMFQISVCGEKLTYQVDQIQVVLPYEVDCLEIVEGEDYVTLLTCTPYGINSHRLLVRGTRITLAETEDSPEPELVVDEAPRTSAWMMNYYKGVVAGVIAAAVGVVIAVIVTKRRGRRG